MNCEKINRLSTEELALIMSNLIYSNIKGFRGIKILMEKYGKLFIEEVIDKLWLWNINHQAT